VAQFLFVFRMTAYTTIDCGKRKPCKLKEETIRIFRDAMPAEVNPSISYKNKRSQIGRDTGTGWKLSSQSFGFAMLI
jgi:hypothetical protein